MSRYALGIDFGTESARAVLVRAATGEALATAVSAYRDGVIDRRLPASSEPLPPDYALQNTRDWLAALESTVRQVLATGGVPAEDVIGLGLDFTACTVLPTRADGAPLHTLPDWAGVPHAWPKLWKHHAAQPQADRVNALAARRAEAWLPRYGGKISSEWLLPKALQILEEAPEVYAAADRIVEGADWVTWQLTGRLARNACGAGYKGNWQKGGGFPSGEYLSALDPRLVDLFTRKMAGPVVAPGARLGGLTAAWALRLGLREGLPIAAPIIDAHAAVIGGGVGGPGTLFMIMGTSTCHLLMSGSEVPVEGISGVVEDGILPGLFAYEAGQAGAGDIFAWYVQTYGGDHVSLSEKAAALRPGQSGLLALDWWNGCRTPLVDADLSGVILGFSLRTTPEAVYRALIEATAFGTRLIVECFAAAGVPVDAIRVSGGLSQNHLLLQVYADVLQRPIEVCGTEHASARGAAMLGAAAGGAHPGLAEAARAMSEPPARVVLPEAAHRAAYDALHHEYKRLVDAFGRDPHSPLKRLRALRES